MKTGVFANRRAREINGTVWLMKILNRTLLGVISCFLLSAGLSKAAQQLDPLTKSVAINGPHSGAADVGAMACSQPCMLFPTDKSK